MTILDNFGLTTGHISVFAAASVPFAEQALSITLLGIAVISGIITIAQGVINIVKTVRKTKKGEITVDEAIEDIGEILEETKKEIDNDNTQR